MTAYLEFGTPTDGTTLLVEVTPLETDPITRRGRGGDAVVRAGQSIQDTIAAVQPALRSLVHHLRDALSDAEKIEVEFGIKLSADARVIIAGSKTEANFRILVSWPGKSSGHGN